MATTTNILSAYQEQAVSMFQCLANITERLVMQKVKDRIFVDVVKVKGMNELYLQPLPRHLR